MEKCLTSGKRRSHRVCLLVVVWVYHTRVHAESDRLPIWAERRNALLLRFFAEHTEIKPVCVDKSDWRALRQPPPIKPPKAPESHSLYDTPWRLLLSGAFSFPLLTFEMNCDHSARIYTCKYSASAFCWDLSSYDHYFVRNAQWSTVFLQNHPCVFSQKLLKLPVFPLLSNGCFSCSDFKRIIDMKPSIEVLRRRWSWPQQAGLQRGANKRSKRQWPD